MGRPRQISDAAIRAAARETFLEAGPSASVATVASRLGVTPAALFQRVGSKETLLRASLGPPPMDAFETLARGPSAESPARDQLVARLDELMELLTSVVPGLMTLRAAGVTAETAGEPPPVKVRRLLSRWLEQANVTGALRVARPQAMAEGLLGAIEARCFNRHVGGDACAPGDDARFLRDLVDGLVPQ